MIVSTLTRAARGRGRVPWATANGGSLGSDSGLLQRTSGLPHRGQHNFLFLGSNQGLAGQKPVEPVNVLGHNTGDHAVSWIGRTCEVNHLAHAVRIGSLGLWEMGEL
jgi:hypothetical protein